MEKSGRDETIDIAKAVGIILVVLGHTNFEFKNVIYQFHMPLFFFLSGMVWNKNKSITPCEYIKKKLKSLYLPFVKYEMIFLALHNFFTFIGFYNNYYSLKDTAFQVAKIVTLGGGEQLAGPLWFLISSLEIVYMFPLFNFAFEKVKNKNAKLILMLGFSIIIFYIGCYSDFPRMLSRSFIGFLFFCCGYCYKHEGRKIKMDATSAIVSVAVVLVCAAFNEVDISKLLITHKCMLIISGLSGIYVVLYISTCLVNLKERNYVLSILNKWGGGGIREVIRFLSWRCIVWHLR